MNEFTAKDIDWSGILEMTDEEAHRNALADEENPPLTAQQLARMRRAPNPSEIRLRLGMTQKQFARDFQIALGTLRDWEQGAHLPDSTAKAYLRVIERVPWAVLQALQWPVSAQGPEPRAQVSFRFSDNVKPTATFGGTISSIEPTQTGTFTMMQSRVENVVESAA